MRSLFRSTALGAALLFVGGCGAQPAARTPELFDDDRLIHLDAEDLAEQGLKEAYDALAPRMRTLGAVPEPLAEIVDPDAPSYRVRFRHRTYDISVPNSSELTARSTATIVFFEIVNAQMQGTPYRFYAVNGDNDLSGIFLTEPEYRRAVATIPRATDRPYVPIFAPPWFGQPHD